MSSIPGHSDVLDDGGDAALPERAAAPVDAGHQAALGRHLITLIIIKINYIYCLINNNHHGNCDLSAVQIQGSHDADGDGDEADDALAARAPHGAVVEVLEGQVDQGPFDRL